jgi:uroporphyrinogen decarboxylase
MNSRERFLRACKNQSVDRPPVWMMRQAGRALPEYRALRKKYSFEKLLTTPELAAKVSLQPVKRFDLDACIIFSDILVVPEAMGLKLKYSPEISLKPPIRTKYDIARLKIPEVNQALGYVEHAMKNARQELGKKFALLGFSGAPFTLACYMIEGWSSKSFSQAKKMLYSEPELFTSLLEKISKVVADYLRMQMEAGADAVQIFDTWAGELSPGDYEQKVLPVLQELIHKLKSASVPVIYYINGIANLLEPAQSTGADVLGIDWRVSLSEVRKQLGKEQALQGNLDPALLLSSKSIIRNKVHEMINETKGRGHIVNLGHGLLPETPLQNISAFVQAVKDWKK